MRIRAIERVTEASLRGKSFAEADDYLDDLVYDAYHYVFRLVDGATEWNSWLYRLIDADVRVDVEPFLLLPLSVRAQIAGVENNTDPAVIAAFIEETMARYNDYGAMTPSDYNKLYVDGDGSQGLLMFAFDLMETNEYWQAAMREFPGAPVDNASYVYNGTP